MPVVVDHDIQGKPSVKSQSMRGTGFSNRGGAAVAQGEVLNVTLGARPILARRVSSAKATPQMRQSFLEQSIRKDPQGAIHGEEWMIVKGVIVVFRIGFSFILRLV
jgi:hypothetical protein